MPERSIPELTEQEKNRWNEELFHVEQFIRSCEKLGIEIDKEKENQFRIYYENLTKWNKVMNLTAITSLQDVLTKHFLDSLSIVKGCEPDFFKKGIRIIDIGTGAGFPGLPLAIVFPQCRITLMDSLGKRITFLEDTINKLNLRNVETIHARAEDLGHDKKYREKFELAVSRAVADLRVLTEYCLPFVNVGGYFIAYKSEKAQEEARNAVNAVAKLGGSISKEESFEIDGNSRTLIKIKKVKETPVQFPRKAGIPSKEPL